MVKFQRESIRLKDYDYSQSGGYFITICTEKRITTLQSSPIQNIVKYWWNQLPNRYPDIETDEFIMMPNHIHGIIFIVGAVHEPPNYKRAIHELPLHQKSRQMLLPQIIGYFKMNTAKQINESIKTPAIRFWQRNYYEHIIRNESELSRIREYITNNPVKWQFDHENLDRVPNQGYEKEWQWLEGNKPI